MTKFSILVGDAPEDFRQKKIEDMFDFLDSKRSVDDSIVTFANGISEMMLEMVLDNSFKQNPNQILLYICTRSPVDESESSVWTGGEEIRRDVISHFRKLAGECGIDMQIVFDVDAEMVREEEFGYERV